MLNFASKEAANDQDIGISKFLFSVLKYLGFWLFLLTQYSESFSALEHHSVFVPLTSASSTCQREKV
jgi:hypothetical protein